MVKISHISRLEVVCKKTGVIQAALQTLYANFQNPKTGTTIYSDKIVVFLTMYIISIQGFLQTTSNLLMWLIFTMVDVIRIWVREIRFSTL